MSDWRIELAHLASNVEHHFDQLKTELGGRLGWQDPLMIQAYFGYGTPTDIYIRGRVLEDKGITAATDQDTTWRNLLNIYRRLESDEVANATIKATCQPHNTPLTQETTSDEEGYFTIHFKLDHPITATAPLTAQLELTAAPNHSLKQPVTTTATIYIPHTKAEYGIISDIDDTVLQSDVSNYLKAAQQLFLNNARSRLPFPGVAALYQALVHGNNNTIEEAHNPVFYVSSSPWNVYTLLVEFFQAQEIPLGPLFLKDYGISDNQLISRGHHDHKLKQIETILNTYPNLSFVLIGDSSQQDPEIYQRIVLKYPLRIKAVYIRDVSDSDRDREVEGIARAISTAGIPMVYVSNSLSAARHAAQIGLIRPKAVTAVESTML
ncbi:MAG TPA: phosphatase domain-containing protein [Anaerolineae bacterium]|nr:phosphatase domain-containing protein [Anaerolineae bacterium]